METIQVMATVKGERQLCEGLRRGRITFFSNGKLEQTLNHTLELPEKLKQPKTRDHKQKQEKTGQKETKNWE